MHLARGALDLRQPRERFTEAFSKSVRVAARLGDQARDARVVEQRQQEMLGLDVLLIQSEGRRLSLGERLLQLRREFLESHNLDPYSFPVNYPFGSDGAFEPTFKGNCRILIRPHLR